jgi:hypothetical protein
VSSFRSENVAPAASDDSVSPVVVPPANEVFIFHNGYWFFYPNAATICSDWQKSSSTFTLKSTLIIIISAWNGYKNVPGTGNGLPDEYPGTQPTNALACYVHTYMHIV